MTEGAAEKHSIRNCPDADSLVELGEAYAYTQLVEGAPAALRREFGLQAQQFGSIHALAAHGLANTLVLNRVLGLGITDPATAADLDLLDALYRDSGIASYAIELSPSALPSNLADLLRGRGFMPFKQTALMLRVCEPIEVPDCTLQVRRVTADDGEAFASLCCGVFGYPEPIPQILKATFESSSWQHWMAFDGNRPVAAAMTHLRGDTAWIGWVCTQPEHRGKGAQHALAAAQLQGAEEAGVSWITLEAAKGSKSKPGQSLRNYQRLGWAVVHDRVVYLRRPQ